MTINKKNEDNLIAYEILKAMDASLEYENVALAAVQAIKTHTKWQTVAISMPDSHDILYVCASIGSLPITRSIIDKTKKMSQNQFVSGLTLEEFDRRQYCVLTACIGLADNCLGVLYAANLESNPLQTDDARLATAIADALAIGLNNVRLMRHLQEQAQG
jgi:K+-sensing histidine kinase KdpD